MGQSLNQEGFTPPRRRGCFHRHAVRQLLLRCGLANERTYDGQLATHEWWLSDLATVLGMSANTLRWWARHGWVRARQTPAQDLWVLYADNKELTRLRKLVARSYQGAKNHPETLTTPGKCRNAKTRSGSVADTGSGKPISSKE